MAEIRRQNRSYESVSDRVRLHGIDGKGFAAKPLMLRAENRGQMSEDRGALTGAGVTMCYYATLVKRYSLRSYYF